MSSLFWNKPPTVWPDLLDIFYQTLVFINTCIFLFTTKTNLKKNDIPESVHAQQIFVLLYSQEPSFEAVMATS